MNQIILRNKKVSGIKKLFTIYCLMCLLELRSIIIIIKLVINQEYQDTCWTWSVSVLILRWCFIERSFSAEKAFITSISILRSIFPTWTSITRRTDLAMRNIKCSWSVVESPWRTVSDLKRLFWTILSNWALSRRKCSLILAVITSRTIVTVRLSRQSLVGSSRAFTELICSAILMTFITSRAWEPHKTNSESFFKTFLR